MKKIILILSLIILGTTVFAQIPDGYYDNATGTGVNLRNQLKSIITNNHDVTSYAGLWTAYSTTDVYPAPNDDIVWDMYSSFGDGTYAYSYSIGSDQCGNVGAEGACYNREHTVPQSWFGGSSPMVSDLFIVYPTDGHVNGLRSSYPYGETDGENEITQNGSKRGACTYPGYTGTVFEPIDAYKGDIARSYFYDVTRYDVSSWNGASFDGNGFSDWTLAMLLEWNALDPVSQKEIDRNNAVYDIQHNRNPYIDHPEWVCEVFGGSCGSTVENPDNLVATGTTETEINLTWDLNTNNDDILLAYNTTNSFGTPSNGTITGDGTILYSGSNLSYTHTGLDQQMYYYKLWSYDGTEYSSGITTSSTPLMPYEPSNHVTDFTVSQETATSISLTWTDATGLVIPYGYLIKASYANVSITPPTDGQSEDNSIFTKNVLYGVETVTFDNLNYLTSYDFEIFPYSNPSAGQDYKTDETIPTATGTTTQISSDCGNETFDGLTTGGTSYTSGSFTGQDGSIWSYTDSRTDQNVGDGAAICVRNGYVESGTVQNGISDITITTQRVYAGTDANLTIKINGNAVGTVPYSDVEQTTTISGINISGNITLTIETPGNGDRVVIDNVIWSCMGGSSGNDNNTDVTNPTSQIAEDTILSTNTNYVDVFSFAVEDLGTTDGLSTFISSFKVYTNTAQNTADWTNSISSVKVSDGTNDISLASIEVTDNYINIPFSTDYEINDNSTTEFTISIAINNDQIVNNKILSFMIDADNSGFVANESGSDFSGVFNLGTDILSNNFTFLIPADEDSEVYTPTTQIPGATILSTDTDYVDVFSFAVKDLGTNDGYSTFLTSLKIYPNPSENTANWSDLISSVKINDETNDINLATVEITDEYINIPFTTDYEINDNSTTEFTISITINEDQVVNNEILAFMIDADNSGFVANENGSNFSEILNSGTDIFSNNFTLLIPENLTKINSNDISIYPNPSSNGVFNISSNNFQKAQISIYDVNGTIIYSKTIDNKQNTIDISNSERGIYFIKIETENTIDWQKIIVQ